MLIFAAVVTVALAAACLHCKQTTAAAGIVAAYAVATIAIAGLDAVSSVRTSVAAVAVLACGAACSTRRLSVAFVVVAAVGVLAASLVPLRPPVTTMATATAVAEATTSVVPQGDVPTAGSAEGTPEAACPEESTSRACYVTYFNDFAERNGTSAATSLVMERIAANPASTVTMHCHDLLHELAVAGLAEAGNEPEAALALVADPSSCALGYLHGVFNAWLGGFPAGTVTTQGPKRCAEATTVDTYVASACFHMLGHQMMAQGRQDPTTALAACASAPVKSSLYDCRAGGWMEFFIDPDHLETITGTLTVDDALAPCTQATDEEKAACYAEIGPQLLNGLSHDPVAMLEACKSSPDQANLDDCYRAVGRGLGTFAGYDPGRAVALCSAVTDSVLRDECGFQVGRAMSFNTGRPDEGLQLCSIVSETKRAACIEGVTDNQVQWHGGLVVDGVTTAGSLSN